MELGPKIGIEKAYPKIDDQNFGVFGLNFKICLIKSVVSTFEKILKVKNDFNFSIN